MDDTGKLLCWSTAMPAHQHMAETAATTASAHLHWQQLGAPMPEPAFELLTFYLTIWPLVVVFVLLQLIWRQSRRWLMPTWRRCWKKRRRKPLLPLGVGEILLSLSYTASAAAAIAIAASATAAAASARTHPCGLLACCLPACPSRCSLDDFDARSGCSDLGHGPAMDCSVHIGQHLKLTLHL